MGLFNKLKSSMNGGVEVHVQAPSSVPSDQVIQVTVSVTSPSSQTISSVKAEIKAEAREEGVTIGSGGVGAQSSQTMEQTVAQAESREPFTISPGEMKTVNLQLFLNGPAGSGGPLGPAGGTVNGILKSVVSAAQNMEHINYIYSVRGSVDVQGHNLNPSDKQPIQILPPIGTAAAPPQQVANLQPPSQVPNQPPLGPLSANPPAAPGAGPQPPIPPNPGPAGPAT